MTSRVVDTTKPSREDSTAFFYLFVSSFRLFQFRILRAVSYVDRDLTNIPLPISNDMKPAPQLESTRALDEGI